MSPHLSETEKNPWNLIRFVPVEGVLSDKRLLPVKRDTMSANPKEFLTSGHKLTDEASRPFPASRKIYVEGLHGIRVPMREVSQTPTKTRDGIEPNPPVTVYDTSGPYTDPSVKIDLLAEHNLL